MPRAEGVNQPAARDMAADLLKGTAIPLMIQVHIVELFARQEIMDGGAGRVLLFLGGVPVAPVFLAVLGFYALRSGPTSGRVILRGGCLIALGGLLNVGLNLHLLLRMLFGSNVHLRELDAWAYVLGADILFLAGASLMAIVLLRTALKSQPLLWIAASVGVASAAPWMTDLLTTESGWKWPAAFIAGRYRWSYFPVFPWLAYPLLGVAAFHLRERVHLSRRGGAIALALGLPILLFSAPFAIESSHDLPAYYHHGVALFLWNGVFLVLWTLLHARIASWRNGVTNWLAWLGRNVTACYVVQWLLIGNLATAFYKTQTLFECVLWFVFVLVATSALVRAYAGPRRRPVSV